jgi:hypothetical protein
MTKEHAAEVLGLLLLYIPQPFVRQLLHDIYRSRASRDNAHFREAIRLIVVEAERQIPQEKAQ